MSKRKTLWISLGAAAVLAGGVGWIANRLLDQQYIEAQVVRSLSQATGRAVTIGGKFHLTISINPKIFAEDVRMANLPGGSRQDMAHVERVVARVYLPALLRHQLRISRLYMKGPNILFETIGGKPNWLLDDPNAPMVTAPPAQTNAAPAAAWTVYVGGVRIRDGLIAWKLPDRQGNIGIRMLEAGRTHSTDDVDAKATLVHEDHPFALTVHAKPQIGDLDKWQTDARVGLADAAVTLQGTTQLSGPYNMVLSADIPRLDAITPWTDGITLPPLKGVTLRALVINTQGYSTKPQISNVAIHIGGAENGVLAKGWTLNAVDLAIPKLGAPATLHGAAEWQGQAVPFDGTVTLPAQLAPTMAVPFDLRGFNPAFLLHDARWQGVASADATGSTLHLRDMQLTAKEAAISGDAAITKGERPRIQARLQAARLDIDQILAASGDKTSGTSMWTQKLPWSMLQNADIDLNGRAARTVLFKQNWTGAAFTLDLANGVIRHASLATSDGDDRLTETLSANAANHSAAITLHADALPLATVLKFAGLPGNAQGSFRVNADLQGTGADLRAIGAGLNGKITVRLDHGAMSDNDFVLLTGPALKALGVTPKQGGTTPLECTGMDADFAHGEGKLRDIAFDTPQLKLWGTGLVNLNDSSVVLKLHPFAMLVGSHVSVPVLVKGRFDKLDAKLDADGLDQAGLMLDALFGGDTPDICRRTAAATTQPAQLPHH